MYKTILVPLDGSKRAEKILPHVEQIALLHQATVIFIQIVEPTATLVTPYDMVPYYDAEQLDSWMNEAKEYLAGLKGEFREKGIETKAFVEQGPVVRTILDVAERENADLIAMASHGRSGLARVFYGSIAAGILNQADRPLLLVRAQHE
jgi:nucleotide-binding universal stress UspA family protein